MTEKIAGKDGKCSNDKAALSLVSREILRRIKENGISGDKALNSLKKKVAEEMGFSGFISNIKILSSIDSADAVRFRELFMTKPGRSQSGVSVVAIMTKPIKCPHGKCIYCPGGPESFFGDTPQSYTGKEPAARRAMRAFYDPYLQVMNRLEQYTVTGHIPEKAELIIMGGTFPSFDDSYQDEFVSYSFKAMNDFSSEFFRDRILDSEKFRDFFELPCDVTDEGRTEKIQKKLLLLKGNLAPSLSDEQLKNEYSLVRCVAMCIETRPDYCKKPHIEKMLRLGATRVEIGVQSIYDSVLNKIERGHSVKDIVEATRLLKNSFLKVGYHMMIGLPLSSSEDDVNGLREIFENSDFRPDNLKIYPCMVIKGTKLYDMWKNKAGVEMTNLRQMISNSMRDEKLSCRCIRCREPRGRKVDYEMVRIKRIDYDASLGKEIFLSFEDAKNDIIIGFCRLRIPCKPFIPGIGVNSAGIRELHVYGESLPIGSSFRESSSQHRGFGKMLISEAERIAKEEFGCSEIHVISGVGVREYYRSIGYSRNGAYMSKKI
ncbi:MAG: tRNA uridine(34) 5-carboxymethylaminomethyl modification radical SAM/GNAT enzyme Elp3 [Candidatus Woesearchaeota archaeon]|nr:tRNA uridine(34) 5-carboxymethylaminomethyl modification radical SAM/GNAT enzyme Elp3 [Candidatus Woesearchaeota archaeon]